MPSKGNDGANFTTPTIINGATSPAARATASISPVIMAGVAIGRTVFQRVSAFVAPSARLPSRILLGIRAKPSSVETITTGTVRRAKVKEDHKSPGVPNVGAGSASGKNDYRIVNVLDYELDFKPEGNMLFIKNKDVPGVVGKIGVLLSKFDINIGEYLLSRSQSDEFAYSVIKVDSIIKFELIEKLLQNDEIISINQIKI